ncbi:MAG: guanylate kinase [Ktedonobacteraceae bacterium]
MQLETEQTVSQQPCTPSSTPATPAPGQGLLFVLSAPSGTGKDTVIHALKQLVDFYLVASVTTRNPRVGESEGNPYYFISKQEFEQLIADNELLEYANVHGNWYGQPLKPIHDNLREGRDVLLKIDVQGAATVRKKVPRAIFIFLVPDSLEELAQRLTQRQTETEAERGRRLADAQKELAEKDWYDYIITNRQGHLKEAVELLRAIMLAEHARIHPRHVTI